MPRNFFCIVSVVSLLVLFLITVIVAYYIYTTFFNKNKLNSNITIENYESWSSLTHPALAHPASCVDCERQYSPSEQWRGQPSKCFSCESDMLKRYGEEGVFMGTKQKCFDC